MTIISLEEYDEVEFRNNRCPECGHHEIIADTSHRRVCSKCGLIGVESDSYYDSKSLYHKRNKNHDSTKESAPVKYDHKRREVMYSRRSNLEIMKSQFEQHIAILNRHFDVKIDEDFIIPELLEVYREFRIYKFKSTSEVLAVIYFNKHCHEQGITKVSHDDIKRVFPIKDKNYSRHLKCIRRIYTSKKRKQPLCLERDKNLPDPYIQSLIWYYFLNKEEIPDHVLEKAYEYAQKLFMKLSRYRGGKKGKFAAIAIHLTEKNLVHSKKLSPEKITEFQELAIIFKSSPAAISRLWCEIKDKIKFPL